jgi:hypothetical protein
VFGDIFSSVASFRLLPYLIMFFCGIFLWCCALASFCALESDLLMCLMAFSSGVALLRLCALESDLLMCLATFSLVLRACVFDLLMFLAAFFSGVARLRLCARIRNLLMCLAAFHGFAHMRLCDSKWTC